MSDTPKFQHVSCSQCGSVFGPGDHGFSHCSDHFNECSAPDGRYWDGMTPLAACRAEQAERVPAHVAAQRIMAELAYPHHCAPDDVDALIQRLEALADPAQEAMPSYADTDWRTLAGVSARVLKYLRGDDWRHGA